MSENTNPESGSVTVGQAANAFLSLMDSPTEEAKAQPEEGYQAQAEEESEQSEEESGEQEDYTDESAEETEYQEEETEEPQRFKVKVDNEEIEVTLEELQQGYSRTKDYTKKTQALAETRKAVEAEKSKIEEAKQLRDQYAQRLEVIEKVLNQQATDEVNLAELRENDPIGYAIKVAERAEQEKQLQAVRAEKQKIAQQQEAERQQSLQAHLQQEAVKLKEMIPEFRDEAKAEIARKDIRSYAKSVGFSDEELSQVYDSRAVKTLYNAMMYEKLMKGKSVATKKVQDAPKVLKAGNGGQVNAEDNATKKQMQKLKQSGKKSDAAKLFEKFI
jgi:hypothetical protein